MKHLLLLVAMLLAPGPAPAQTPAPPLPRAQQRADSARAALRRRVGHSRPPALRPNAPLGRPSRRRNPAIVGHLL